jgi:hypothetical protein
MPSEAKALALTSAQVAATETCLIKAVVFIAIFPVSNAVRELRPGMARRPVSKVMSEQ